MLRGDADLPEDVDEVGGFDVVPDRPVEVDYQPALPVEAFDVIIVDECHRSIYGVWRQVLDVVELGELAARAGHLEALELLERLLPEVGPVDEEQDALGLGVAQEPFADVGGAERLA